MNAQRRDAIARRRVVAASIRYTACAGLPVARDLPGERVDRAGLDAAVGVEHDQHVERLVLQGGEAVAQRVSLAAALGVGAFDASAPCSRAMAAVASSQLSATTITRSPSRNCGRSGVERGGERFLLVVGGREDGDARPRVASFDGSAGVDGRRGSSAARTLHAEDHRRGQQDPRQQPQHYW